MSDEERFDKALRDALDAFWASVAESYPEITTGDLAPGDDIPLEDGAASTLRKFLMWNE